MTLDNIEAPCISINSDLCTSCKNIKQLRELDVVGFNNDPVQKIFGIKNAIPQQSNYLLHALETTCGIKIPTNTKKDPIILISQPDLDTVSKDIQKIAQRLKKKDNRIIKYLVVFQQFVMLPFKWNAEITLKLIHTQEILARIMKQDILHIIQKYELCMGGAHQPIEIPMGVGIYLHELAKAPIEKFNRSIQFLLFNSGCVEGMVQMAMDCLV